MQAAFYEQQAYIVKTHFEVATVKLYKPGEVWGITDIVGWKAALSRGHLCTKQIAIDLIWWHKV